MANILASKLELFGPLPDDDVHLLDDIVRDRQAVAARTNIIREGEPPTDVHLVLEGLVCRSKLLPDGRRQIFAYLLPGDFCDMNVFILRAMDHDIETISSCTMVDIPRERVLEMTHRPALARALWWATLVDEAVLREWLVNLGQRDAEHRLAHFFCEIHARLEAIGLTSDGEFELPVTQGDLADTLGLSTVHLNRTIQHLRAQGLIHFKGGQLTIPHVDRLRTFADFCPNYLHLNGGKPDLALRAKAT